jgi:hypothetical protein
MQLHAAVSICVLIAGPVPATGAETAAGSSAFGTESVGSPDGYADELIQRQRVLGLSRSAEWSSLLHLRKLPLRAAQSEADGPDFFFAPQGKIDPDAELEATLRAFAGPPVVEDDPQAVPGDTRTRVGTQHPQCRFPARYAYLRIALTIDGQRLPEQPCPRFQEFRRRVDPGGATLIFAAAYVNHPASAFGHTLLRLDRRSAPGLPLLGYAVNFSAVPTTSNGVLYALGGLTGRFRGFFSLLPYYLKVKEYADLESRDLWEYPLNLTQEQVDQMLRHIWELGSTWFDYWFLDENCSYHLLSLIEVAVPGTHLRETFPLWTLPVDTLKALRTVPGLLGEVRRRPSLDTRLKARRQALSKPEARLAHELAETDAAAVSTPLAALPPVRQAAVIDTALDLAQLQLGEAAADEQVAAAMQLRLVQLRGSILLPSADPRIESPFSPDAAHPGALALLGGGSRSGAAFASILLRGVLHDLVSAVAGEMPNQQMEMMRLELRLPLGAPSLSIWEFRLLRIESLDPFDAWTPRIAWRFGTGFVRERLGGPELRMWELRGGPALAYEPWGQLVYAVAETQIALGPDFADAARVRLQPTAGFVLRPSDLFRLRFEGAALWDPSDTVRPLLTAEQAFNLGARWQLRTSASWSRNDWTAQASAGAYF